jgi:transcription antitermination factor NusB
VTTTPIRRRTKAREAAVQFLYLLDLRGDDAMDGLDEFLRHECKDTETRTFAERLIRGTREHRDETDKLLRTVTRNWDLKRMATVDRNVLRMAAYELLHCSDIPPKVAINEAIEIGKKFSTANSGGFINGILDRIRIDYRKDRAATAVDDASETPGQTVGES